MPNKPSTYGPGNKFQFRLFRSHLIESAIQSAVSLQDIHLLASDDILGAAVSLSIYVYFALLHCCTAVQTATIPPKNAHAQYGSVTF